MTDKTVARGWRIYSVAVVKRSSGQWREAQPGWNTRASDLHIHDFDLQNVYLKEAGIEIAPSRRSPALPG